MSVLTEQCKQELCVDVSAHAREIGIAQKVFVTTQLWEAFLLFKPTEKPRQENDIRMTLLLWEVRRGLSDWPGHDTFPALVEVSSHGRDGQPIVLVRQAVEVSVVDGEVVVDIRLAG